ncbi:hypothetical protein ACWC2K_31295 [Streptomyces chattanoogensis]
MTETFNCDYEPGAQLAVRQDPEGFVEITVDAPTVPGAPDMALAAYLKPEAARRFAMAVTLASFAVDGEPMGDALQAEALALKETTETGYRSVPCPETNEGCDSVCSARPECHQAAIEDLFRAAPDPQPADPEPRVSREERFLEARELAGPAASLDDVLKLADFLAA